MTTKIWQGGAPAVAQVNTYVFAGTWEADDVITATIGSRSYSWGAGSTTKATIVQSIVDSWNLLSSTNYPEFAEVTASRSGDNLVLTADTAGKSFVCTLATTESGGGAADDQTIDGSTSSTGVATVANSGPNSFGTAANWTGGVAPVNTDDIVFENSTVDCTEGLAQSGVTLTSLTVKPTYTGLLGLPRNNASGYPEYRTAYLAIGATTATLESGSGRCKINFGTAQTACTVNGSQTASEDGVPAVLLLGTHASNTLTVNAGDVGVAVFAGEVSTIATLKVGTSRNAYCRCGSGVTLTTVSTGGGNLIIESNATTVSQTGSGGTLTVLGAAALTTLNVDGGTCYYNSSGTATTVNVGGTAILDFRDDSRARTVTNANIEAGASIYDPMASVTWTNGIDLERCSPTQCTLDIGTHIRLTRGSVA